MKKTFKNLLSLIVTISLVLSMFVFNVSAATAQVSCKSEYEVGNNFNVKVNFNADANLYVVEAEISYDANVLRFNSVSGADFTNKGGKIKIYDEAFTPDKPSKNSSYTLSFTALSVGTSPISVSLVGGGEGDSYAKASASVKVVAPKPSSNANLSSLKLSSGVLTPAFNANVTNYSATVKYSVESVTISATVADGGAAATGAGTIKLNVGDNNRVISVKAADGTQKTYTINIKRMTEQETLAAEQAERDANPTLVVIDNVDYTIVNDFTNISIPTGFTQGTVTRKETEIAVLNDDHGEYTLFWLVDAAGENGAFYTRDENDVFARVNCIRANGKLYIIEDPEVETIPAAYVAANRTIDGEKVSAYAYADEALKDFYVVKCYVEGARAFYRFDSIEGTVQRAAEFDLALKTANATPTEQNTGRFAWFANMTKTGKMVFVIIVFVAVILIVIAVLVIVKITSSRDNDDDFIMMEDNNFILNDFAEDTFEDNVAQPKEETEPEAETTQE